MVSCKSKEDEEPSPPKSPMEELNTFHLSDGLKIQLVAAEPMVQDPVVITFDEAGRLWVVEMRGFMPDIDGKGENEPVGRISVLEDRDGDGQMDTSTIYIDSLILPRALALVNGGALIVENQALWLTTDQDGDLKADTKTLIDPDYAGSPLPEHSGNGLWRGVDNWYYNVKSRFRYRLRNGEWIRDTTEFRGQWGISHDNEGRLYYNYNWSQLHADLVPPNYFLRNKNHTPTSGVDHGLTLDRRVYPVRPNPAVNRGYIPGTLDKEGRLLEFTAACSPLFYRGITLPEEYYGNVFVCEPSGNLIKRNVVKENGFMLTAYDPHPGKEFLASTDERFRPVHLATGPDGALYIADMYRGLVQHGAHVTPYLREQTLKRKLVQPINRGRIWRVVPANWNPMRTPNLSEVSASGLIHYLSHPNGWHRDIAQRLLIEGNDKSIASALVELSIKGQNSIGRFHALWTLEGLNLITPEILFQSLHDENELVRIAAMRLIESFAKRDKKIKDKLGTLLLRQWKSASIKEVLQITLTSGVLRPQDSHPLLHDIIATYDTSAVIRDAVLSSIPDEEFNFLKGLLQSSAWKMHRPMREIFMEMLTYSVLRKNDNKELVGLLKALDTDKNAFGWQQNSILTAMSIHAINQKVKPVVLPSAPEIFKRPHHSIEQSKLDVVASMFEWPGHTRGNTEVQKENHLTKDEQKRFALGRQHYLTNCAGCHGSDGAGLNRFAPTLIGSDWVLGDVKRLALVVLHGLEGPVNVSGKRYDVPEILPVMPAHSTLDDGAIASILTYIRNEWGNNAGAVTTRMVGHTRHTSQGRVMPWTAEELNKYVQETKGSDPK